MRCIILPFAYPRDIRNVLFQNDAPQRLQVFAVRTDQGAYFIEWYSSLTPVLSTQLAHANSAGLESPAAKLNPTTELMPDLTNIRVSPPANWQDFERLSADLWEKIWRDPNTQLNGRSGQPQAGVDIWGAVDGSPELSGVQCKGKDGGYGKRVTSKQLISEVTKAKQFSPRIAHFIIATTARNDVHIQQLARELSARHKRAGLFTVDVMGWDDISRRIAGYPDVFAKHYPQFALASSGAVHVDVSCLIEPAPDNLRRTVREPFFQGLTYRTSRMDNRVEIRADVPYRDAVAKGGPVTGLSFSIAPLIGRFPNPFVPM